MADRKARVLVVDDNLEMARTVADGLGDRGYDAVAAASGRAAVDCLEATRDAEPSTPSSPICACRRSTDSRSSPSRGGSTRIGP